jgi:hypothetical protein
MLYLLSVKSFAPAIIIILRRHVTVYYCFVLTGVFIFLTSAIIAVLAVAVC